MENLIREHLGESISAYPASIFGRFQGVVEMRRFYQVDTV